MVLQFIEQMSCEDEEAPGPGRSAARQPLMLAALRVLARCAAASFAAAAAAAAAAATMNSVLLPGGSLLLPNKAGI